MTGIDELEYQRANEWLRTQLAKSDQQIEWLSRENAALKRHAEEVTVGLRELKRVADEALAVVRERVAHDAAELAAAHATNIELEKHARELEARIRALMGRPGTMYFGPGGVYLFAHAVPSQEVLDAVESLRAEHYRNTEDEWYSCPKSGECWRDLPDDMCICGADAQNAALDVVLAYLKGERNE